MILFSVSMAIGQISLSGTVTAVGGAPVAGAKVYLSNHPAVSTLTGEQGDFSLTESAAIRYRQGALSRNLNTISFSGNRMIVTCQVKQPMKIETYNCRGELVNARHQSLIAGQNIIAVTNNLQAHGMFTVKVRIGNDNFVSSFLSMGHGQWSAVKTKASASGLSKKKMQASAMDSLVVSAKGFLLAKQGLDGFTQQNIMVMVQPFTPIGMKLIPSKDSTFMMGSDDQSPAHNVSFSRDWYMDSVEVTQGDYSAVMQGIYAVFTAPNWGQYGKSDDIAAYFINWNDAILYCNARSKRDMLDTVYSYTLIDGIPGNGSALNGVNIDYQKNGYRLPTEAEWEYACRAGTKTDWYFDTAQSTNFAWFNFNSQSMIYPVAKKLPNHFGLYDMNGNIWEWVNDWYNDYSADSQTDPVGPNDGTEKIWRGGSWGSYLYVISSVYRGHSDLSAGLSDNGFRCVLPK
jgi:formylglycine-generating enzyme required for sulfatase activity